MSLHEKNTEAANGVLKTYVERIRAFKPNAWKYLIGVLIYGTGYGVYNILLNFYLRSLGYDETFMGLVATTASMTVLIAALPMGYLADILGRKYSLVIASLLIGPSIVLMVAFPSSTMMIAMNIVLGIGSSLGGVTTGAFPDGKQRGIGTNLSLQHRLRPEDGRSFRRQLDRRLSSHLVCGGLLGTSAISPTAYTWAIGASGVFIVFSVIPRLMLKRNRLAGDQKTAFAPISFARKNPGMLSKLLLPMFMTSIGAGLIMPFMNIFFSTVHHQPDQVVGAVFAWGSLAMGIGFMMAPAFADQLRQDQGCGGDAGAFTIPFLILLGFSPWFGLSLVAYFFRVILMNMSSPVYQTFVMDAGEQRLPGDGGQPEQHGSILWTRLQPDHQRLDAGILWVYAPLHRDDHHVLDFRSRCIILTS